MKPTFPPQRPGQHAAFVELRAAKLEYARLYRAYNEDAACLDPEDCGPRGGACTIVRTGGYIGN